MSLRAEVVVASNRAAAGVYDDETGPLIVEFLQRLGFAVDAPVVVPDGDPVGEAIAAAADGRRAGRAHHRRHRPDPDRPDPRGDPARCSTARCPASPRRSARPASPRASRPPRCRAASPASSASCLVVNLPGSRGGVKDGLAVLEPILVHAVEQIVGSDH